MKSTSKKLLLTALALIMSLELSACGGIIGSSQSDGRIEPETAAETEAAKDPVIPRITDPDAPDKAESVHVSADASGKPEKITVEVTLKNPGGSAGISDTTTLSDIKNKTGDEEFTLKDGQLVFENHGEDIKYEGTSAQELPVSVSVSYFLDGAQLTPEEISGKSGHVKIRFDYSNATNETVMVKDAEYSVPIPFTAVTAAFLPADSFYNVSSENGRVMKMDDRIIVMGMAFPGLKKALRLSAWEPTEDIDIPEYVEIEADVVDFTLDFTATVITNSLLEDLEDGDLNDFDDMADNMDDLKDAIDDMADGSEELADGLKDVKKYLTEYVDGVGAVNKGTKALAEGLSKMNEQKTLLTEGAEGLSEGLSALADGIGGIGTLDPQDEDSKVVINAVKKLVSEGKTLSEIISKSDEDRKKITEFREDAVAYVKKLRKSYKKVKKALEGIDLTAVDSQATELARSQADAALSEALDGLELSEKQVKRIKKKVRKSIDLKGITAAQISEIRTAIDALTGASAPAVPELEYDKKAAEKSIKKMEKQVDILLAHSDKLKEMADTAASFGNTLNEMKQGVNELSAGSESLATGLAAFAEGIEQLDQGASALKNGTGKLKSAGNEMVDGMDELIDGVDEMADSLKEYKEEDSEDLDKFAGPEMRRIINTVRALRESDRGYCNYSGILPGKTGEVRFLIETAEIK